MTRRVQWAGMASEYTESIQTPQKCRLRLGRVRGYAPDWAVICEVKMGQHYEVCEPSGIYQIRCRRNGKVYVGSSIDIEVRWKTHRRELTKRTHCNRYLQGAWIRYGARCFDFLVLELVDVKVLRSSEKAWIAPLGATDRRRGFNINRHAGGGHQRLARTWEGFRDPTGTSLTIVNLHEFCRRNQLDFPSMHRLSKGKSKLKSYKGWTHVNSLRVREYIKVHEGYVDPSGNLVGPITNL